MSANMSVGALYSCRDLLNYCQQERLSAVDLHRFFDKYYVAESRLVSDICQICKWFTLSPQGIIETTESGREITKKSPVDALRIQIRDFILESRPPWGALIPRGRKEATSFFSDDVIQCFDEAELLWGLSESVIDWWDELASAARGLSASNLSVIGRKGEKLSMLYETERTGREPSWIAIESNLAGFDIQSILSSESDRELLIEVKASEKTLRYAEIYISANEWRVAQQCKHHLFHVWANINSKPELYVFKKSAIQKHIPKNNAQGIWQNVRIPLPSLSKDAEAIF